MAGRQATVWVTGIPELDAKLRTIEQRLAKKIYRRSVRKAAKPVLDTARSLAPVESGDLKRSLKIRAMKRSRRNKHQVGVQVVTGKEWFKGDQFYAAFIEFGAPGHKFFGKGEAPLEPKPFLRPAADANKSKVADVFRAEMRRELEEAAREPAGSVAYG